MDIEQLPAVAVVAKVRLSREGDLEMGVQGAVGVRSDVDEEWVQKK